MVAAGAAVVAAGAVVDGFWSLAHLSADVQSLMGPKILMVTAVGWEATPSMPLLGDEDEDEDAAAAAAHSRRLSASFFSLEMPGEEQEVRGNSWPSVILVEVVLGSEDLGLPAAEEVVVLGLSALGGGGSIFPLGLFKCGGGAGLEKVSLLTEMKALPGVEKGRGA